MAHSTESWEVWDYGCGIWQEVCCCTPWQAERHKRQRLRKGSLLSQRAHSKQLPHSHSGPTTSTWASNKSHILGWLIAQLGHGNLTGALRAQRKHTHSHVWKSWDQMDVLDLMETYQHHTTLKPQCIYAVSYSQYEVYVEKHLKL